jgi:hypothetical protein
MRTLPLSFIRIVQLDLLDSLIRRYRIGLVVVTLFIPTRRTATVTVARKPEPGWNLGLYFQFPLGGESKQCEAAHYWFLPNKQQSSTAEGISSTTLCITVCRIE